MKNYLLIAGVLILVSCGNRKKPSAPETTKDTVAAQAPAEDKSYLKKRPEEFPDFYKLSNVQPFKGKVATKKDVESKNAVFVMQSDDPSHKPCDIHLPFFAFRKVKGGQPIFVAVVQAEELKGDTLLGYRQGNGIYGMCRPGELDYFENEKDLIFRKKAPAVQ